MIIYHNVEIANRELDSKLLCAIFSAAYGNSSLLSFATEFNFLNRLRILPSGFYHTKSVAPTKTQNSLFPRLKKYHFLISSIDEESGLLSESFSEFGNRRFSNTTLEHTTYIFTWGDIDQSYLTSKFPNHINQFIKSGSPRVDLWSKKFSNCYKPPSSAHRKYILLPSNFGINSPLPIWKMLSNLKSMGYPLDRTYVSKFFSAKSEQLLLFDRFIDMVIKLSEYFPDFDIIIRPHPVECPDAWTVFTSHFSNIYVDSSLTLTDWIHGASLIIHHGCTSAVESAYIGKPVISYLSDLSITQQPSISNQVGFQAHSLDTLLEFAESILLPSDPIITNDYNPLSLSTRFLQNPNYAANTMSYYWNQHRSAFLVQEFSNIEIIFMKTILFFLPFFSFLLRLFSCRNPFFDKTLSKFPYLSSSAISQKVKSLCNALGLPEVSVHYLSPRCFLIAPKVN